MTVPLHENLADEPDEKTMVEALKDIYRQLPAEAKASLDDLTEKEWKWVFQVSLNSWALPLNITAFVSDGLYQIRFLCFVLRVWRNTYYAGIRSSIFKPLALWVWNHLADGKAPFYQDAGLQKHQAPVPPDPTAWRGWKRWLWNKAVDHLVWTRDISYTPALKVKF